MLLIQYFGFKLQNKNLILTVNVNNTKVYKENIEGRLGGLVSWAADS